MKGSLLRAMMLALTGAALGLAANRISPRGISLRVPPPPTVAAGEFLSLAEARRLWLRGDTVFLDAREPGDYAAGHIGNALNLPAQSFAQHFGEVSPLLTQGAGIVVYCDGVECDLSHRLAGSLREAGITNSHILFNGWTVWREAGLPTSSGGSR